MHPNIKIALKHLEDANISGYFEEMDKVEMSASQKTTHNIHRARFIAGDTPYNFQEQLRLFALDVAKKLEEVSQAGNAENTTSSVRAYKTQNIFKLINACYNDEDLQLFCTFHFEKVAENFSTGMTKNQKIMALIDAAKRSIRTDELLELVKEEHQQQYEQYKPYY